MSKRIIPTINPETEKIFPELIDIPLAGPLSLGGVSAEERNPLYDKIEIKIDTVTGKLYVAGEIPPEPPDEWFVIDGDFGVSLLSGFETYGDLSLGITNGKTISNSDFSLSLVS